MDKLQGAVCSLQTNEIVVNQVLPTLLMPQIENSHSTSHHQDLHKKIDYQVPQFQLNYNLLKI